MVIDTQAQLNSFNERLKKLNEGITILKEYGLNEDILEAYLMVNLKIGKAEAQKIMDCYEDFYEKVLKKITLKQLKEER
jgi:hypothetical protein